MLKLINYPLLITMLFFCACKNNSSDSSTASVSSAGQLKGIVIDGYIAGAKVCLDLNANQSCDTAEPSTTTTSDGQYTLNLKNISADQLQTTHLLAVVPTSAKDSDDFGKTLAEVSKKSYTLMAPMVVYSDTTIGTAIISPFTTLVSYSMLINNSDLITAEDEAIALTGLDIAGIYSNFIDSYNQSAQYQSQIISTALAEVRAGILNLSNTTSPPSEQDALFAGFYYIKNHLNNLITAINSSQLRQTISLPQVTRLAMNTLSASFSLKSTLLNSLLSLAQQHTNQTASSAHKLLSTGIYRSSGCWVNTIECSVTLGLDKLSVIAGKTSTNSGSYYITHYQYSNNAWITKISDPNTRVMHANTGGWITTAEEGSYLLNGDIYTRTDKNSELSDYSQYNVIDISNQKPKDLVGWHDGSALSEKYPNFIFPPGSRLIRERTVLQTNVFKLFMDKAIKKIAVPTSLNTDYVSTLGELITLYADPPFGTTNGQNPGSLANEPNILTLNDAYLITFGPLNNSSYDGNASVWSSTKTVSCTPSPTVSCRSLASSRPYKIKDVVSGNGALAQKILFLYTQAYALNTAYFFIANSNKIYWGEYKSKDTVIGSTEDNSNFFFNKTALLALCQLTGKSINLPSP